jgi:hypothetical protein
MAWSSPDLCAYFEMAVVFFQVLGVAGLCTNRLADGARWARRGRSGFVVGLIGLGVAGAMCGGQDSEFALFAGGTMTLLLIGMTVGGGATASTAPTARLFAAEPTPVG